MLTLGGVTAKPASGPCPAIVSTRDVDLRQGSFLSGEIPIHYVEAGDLAAPPLILVHGFMTDGRQNWGPAISSLSEHFRVIVMDARGHGQSGKPHKADAYGRLMAADVIALMDHLGIGKANVGGFSMGGLITLYLAANYPDRLLSAIVGGFGLREQPLPAKGGPLSVALDEAIRTGDSLSAVLERQNAKYADLPVFRYEPILSFYRELRRVEMDPAALRLALQSMPALHITPGQAKEIKVPLLAISGDRDPALADMMALRAAHPQTALALVPFCGHLSAAASEPFVRTIVMFALNPDP